MKLRRCIEVSQRSVVARNVQRGPMVNAEK